MNEPFLRRGDRVRVRLSAAERAALTAVPDIIAESGDAGGRFDYQAHPDDPEAEDAYRRLVGSNLDSLRRADRAAFITELDEAEISLDTAEAWMRVIGEARIALATRLGIEEDGWEARADPEADPEMAMLTYLGFLQEELVSALT